MSIEEQTDVAPIEQVARYLQARNTTNGIGWDDITERGRQLYLERARDIAALMTTGPGEGDGTATERMAGPVHGWFELSYSSYQVLPRVLMHSMPLPWQRRMVACLEEMRAAFGHVEQAPGYDVRPCDWAAPHDVSDTELRAAGVEIVDEDGETVYYREGDQLDPHVTCVPVPAVEPLPPYRRAFVQPWPAEAAT